MSGEIFNRKIVAVGKIVARGLGVYQPQNITPPYRDSCQFQLCTGTTAVPDFTGIGTVTMLEDSAVPSGMRCYVTRLDVDVEGSSAWSSTALDAVTLQDSAGVPIAFLPMNSLRGYSAYTFPDSDTEYPFTLQGSTMSGISYAAGVITGLSASTLISGKLVGVPFTVIGGTGKYSTGVISANTSTGLTLSPAPALVDSTSVIAIWYWPVTAASSTTVTFSNAASSSPAFAANALDNGFNTLLVSGTGAGQVRPISANTTTVVTAAYQYNATPDTTTLAHISNEQNLFGAVDMGIAEKWPVLSLNRGIQLAISANGTVTAGSPLRVYVEGFLAA